MEISLRQYAQLAAVTIVVVGCWLVLHPFVPAIMFAAVACGASWPLYLRLRAWMRGRASLAALSMTLLLVVLVIGPSTLLAFSLAGNATALIDAVRDTLDHGPIMPPDWLKNVPLVGTWLDGYWHRLAASREELVALLKSLIDPARALLVGAAKAVGQSVLQLSLAAFVSFFFYRDGEAIVGAIRNVLRRLAGGLGEELLGTSANTVTGVVNGIFGTALAQALVAVIGFLIAGVPAAFVLGTATFILSMVPIGPPLIWGGAAVWLVQQDAIGWAVFMVAWGVLVISSIDNFVKPYLISRSSSLPILLIVFGVFGGIIAFGFIGVFIGPPVLAVGLTLVQFWAARAPAAGGS